jgi:hypothetical protein
MNWHDREGIQGYVQVLVDAYFPGSADCEACMAIAVTGND